MGRRKKEKGLGDIIQTVTEATGIDKVVKVFAGDDCGCNERREALNFKYPIKLKPRCMTPEEIQSYSEFKKERTLKLNNAQRIYLCKIYSDVFQVPYYEPYLNCSASPYIMMINRMDNEFKLYENEN